ncbi:MAG: hypothetical protein LBK29_00770 [Oscillospiraceae bacterium]|jgi:hypothetical protein|nr:hypothetical protein [Oscillospiraceae bacterium]
MEVQAWYTTISRDQRDEVVSRLLKIANVVVLFVGVTEGQNKNEHIKEQINYWLEECKKENSEAKITVALTPLESDVHVDRKCLCTCEYDEYKKSFENWYTSYEVRSNSKRDIEDLSLDIYRLALKIARGESLGAPEPENPSRSIIEDSHIKGIFIGLGSAVFVFATIAGSVVYCIKENQKQAPRHTKNKLKN